MERFKQILDRHGIESEIRVEKGTDIDAACGQLRRRNLK
jgi:23S rRNA (adenine2503-C2)-methyltransferase